MAEEPTYNLLQAIDPSKIRVPISDRFCKLTLSSNKKKKAQESAKADDDVAIKRDSASRNLLAQLSQQQQPTSSNNSSSSPPQQHVNPLLRSVSSKDHSETTPDKQKDKSHLGEYFEITMDSLNVTEDGDEDEAEVSSQMEQLDVDLLSQKVSALSVVCHRQPLSLSSSSTDPLNELTQLVSTESQRSSMAGELPKFHKIKQIPIQIIKREFVVIPSSSSSSSSGKDVQTYIITDEDDDGVVEEEAKIVQNDKQLTNDVEDEYEKDDYEEDDDAEDDYEEDDDDVITISDSSTSLSPEEQSQMGVSTLRTIQELGERTIREFRQQLNLPLPKTLSPDKMERVAAFLRDVSMEQRNRTENGYNPTEDSICNYNLPTEGEKTLEKAKKMTTADTESMTPEDDDKEDTPEAIRERQRRLKALAAAAVMPEDQVSEESHKEKARRLANAETQDNTIASDLQNNERTPQNRERRLVSADTVANSTISDVELDSSMSLQVTPTPRRNIEEVKKSIYAETEANRLMTQMSDLKLCSPLVPKTPQTIKRNDNNDLRRNAKVDTPPLELNYFSPKSQKTLISATKNKQNVRRLASAETEPNTINTCESPSDLKSQKTPQSSKCNKNELQRLASAETEDNTLLAKSSSKLPYSPKSARRAERRLVSADTEENTMSDLQLSTSITSYTSAQGKNERCMALDDTEANTNQNLPALTPEKYHSNVNLSVPWSPIYKTPRKDYLHGSRQSLNSIISSSIEDEACCNDESAPEHSITILETDDEDQQAKSHSSSPLKEPPLQDDNNKLSASFHNNSCSSSSYCSSSSMKQIQMSMANINISAKINIKITIPDFIVESSEDDESQKSLQQRRDNNSLSDQVQSGESNSQRKQMNSAANNGGDFKKADTHQQVKGRQEEVVNSADIEEIILDSDNSNVEDDNFVDAAAKLLTQLYGNSWQTPDVLRNLRKTKESDDKMDRTSFIATNRREKHIPEKSNTSKVVEDSVLGDFSMFRQNIVKTNSLDSTRLRTPNTKTNKGITNIKDCRTEPRNSRQESEKEHQIEMPQTKSCRKPTKTKNQPTKKISAHQIRLQNEKWRQLVDGDNDSECNNASDDDEPDKSWNVSKAEINDSDDFMISPEKPKRKTTQKRTGAITKDATTMSRRNVKTKSQKRKDTSADNIIYLDLSKEEVEVQDDVPQSPPANHDVTFASKLDEILKTCRHEDKPKMPSSSATSLKSKRKLFTPNFGLDLEADLSGVEAEKKENRKIDCAEDADADGLLLDSVVCPFDAQGKPKKLELYNKQLEALKESRLIFTPSPKKVTTTTTTTPLRRALAAETGRTGVSTPKSKTKTKTPTTATNEVATTGSIDGISRTPDYKYSFLKSLDATVSNHFAHPDARIYRDNYRTNKEDLSRILYDLYNEKLFQKSLDVPATWNKKLINTAGRCLNKKKLGVRTSVIELSEKVLTSADRLRCTLIHELCHAATWIFNGEGGHGKTWKEWAYKANVTFPELPKIGVCHQYEIEYKYTYKCTLCAAKSHAHSKSKKVENIRCSYCHGAIEIFLNKKDKDGNIMPTPVKEATGFAKFVKDNYKKYKKDDMKHADVMKVLSSEFASMKLTKNDK